MSNNVHHQTSDHIEIGLEDENTFVIRMRLNGYGAVELHDRMARSSTPFTITFHGHPPRVVNMENPVHPIESFPVKLPEPPIDPWTLAWCVTWCFWIGVIYG